MVSLQALAAIMAIPLASAHPGDNIEAIKHEISVRNEAHAYATRALSKCQGTAESLALKERTAARRAAKAADLRRKRGLNDSTFNCFPETKQLLTGNQTRIL
jgi:hypothetical protein